MERRTTLYETHVKYGGKIVPFAGYLLPVQYETGVIREHMAVRTACGLFDVSHMGEILCRGEDALKNLNHLLTNDFAGMVPGQARYSPMCNESGGVVDDLIAYKVAEDVYLLVVNAANKEKDFQWMKDHRTGGAEFTDLSDLVGQIALQGPKAETILRKLTDEEDIPQKNYTCTFRRMVGGRDGVECIISRTGYTGEDGFEFYLAAEEAPKLWELLMEAGKEEGLIPCGLGARDTLRLEAAMPLYGHEMNDEITPLEAGLGIFVKLKKEEFIGKDPMEAMKEAGGPARKRVGLKVTGRGIIREQEPVFLGTRQIGTTTSGTHCPYLKAPSAMALVDADQTAPGTAVEVEVRGRRVAAEIVPLPFYKREK